MGEIIWRPSQKCNFATFSIVSNIGSLSLMARRLILLPYHLQLVKGSRVSYIFAKIRISKTRDFSWLLLQCSPIMIQIHQSKTAFWNVCVYWHHKSKSVSL